MQISAPPRNPLVPSARRAATALIALVLGACASYPLGMSEAEWKRLTPEQQMEARNKQAELSRARAQQRAQQAAERRQRYAAMEAAEQRRLAELYQAARFGDIVDCVIDGGVGDVRARGRPFGPIAFTLARGEHKAMALGGSRFWTSYSTDGNRLRICYRDPRHFGYANCATVGTGTRDFTYGITRRADVRHVFRGARVSCAFRPGDGMPRWVMRRRNVEVYRVIHHHHYRDRRPRGRVVIRDHRDDRRYERRDDRRYDRWSPRPGVAIRDHRDQREPARPGTAMRRDHRYETAPPRPNVAGRERDHESGRSPGGTVMRRDDRGRAPAATPPDHDVARRAPPGAGPRYHPAPARQPVPAPVPPRASQTRGAAPPVGSADRRPEPAPRVPPQARARDRASERSAVQRGAPPPKAAATPPGRTGGPVKAALREKKATEGKTGKDETPPDKRGGGKGRGAD